MAVVELDLLEYLDEEAICFLEAEEKEGVLQELVDSLPFDAEKKEKVFSAIIQREDIVSTGIGSGVALPHARCPKLDEFTLRLGFCREGGIDWNSIDHLPVRIVCLIVGPDEMKKEYLTLLSQLTTFLKEDVTRTKLLSAKEKREVVKILES